MRAITISGFGAEPVLTDLPAPEHGPHQVLVRLHAAGFNPFDLKVADGALKDAADHHFPLVLGSDGAGVVQAVGDQVTRFRPGDHVYGQFLDVTRGIGSYAEYAVADAEGPIAPMPHGMIYEQAAAVPTSATTAAGLVETAQVDVGQTVLVIGATGGVGQAAVQLCADRGAHVVATAAPDSADLLTALGAAETVDYTTGTVPAQIVAAHPGGVDVIIDLVTPAAGIEPYANLLRPGGTYLSTVFALNPDGLAARQVHGVNYSNQATSRRLADLADLIDAGRLKIRIEHQVPLSDAPATLDAARDGDARGKTVFRI
ncbi:NADP-dependent oxidoreductase [Actinomadura flavalba]|uniref:NADP-dependent oxidoreductase n=1 Tax=Actinomadura flavalba TaxID=1120938 RepID=UPI0003A4FF77|nr:NADP-dependent oxidoreductase [Actinomadura flavalba]